MDGGQTFDAVLMDLEPRHPCQGRWEADFPSHRFAAEEVLNAFFVVTVKWPQCNMTICTSSAQAERRAETESCDLRDAVAGVLARRE